EWRLESGEFGRVGIGRTLNSQLRALNEWRLQLVAQPGEFRTEAIAARRRIAPRPEQLDQGLPLLGAAAVVGQVGEQRSGFLRPEPADDPAPLYRSQFAQQLDSPPGLHCTSRLPRRGRPPLVALIFPLHNPVRVPFRCSTV